MSTQQMMSTAELSRWLLPWLNSRYGAAGGIPGHVVAMENPYSVDANSLFELKNSLALPASNTLTCHVTLVFDDGQRQPGILQIHDPGGSLPLKITWAPNTQQ